jgi:hypothetical protein
MAQFYISHSRGSVAHCRTRRGYCPEPCRLSKCQHRTLLVTHVAVAVAWRTAATAALRPTSCVNAWLLRPENSGCPLHSYRAHRPPFSNSTPAGRLGPPRRRTDSCGGVGTVLKAELAPVASTDNRRASARLGLCARAIALWMPMAGTDLLSTAGEPARKSIAP